MSQRIQIQIESRSRYHIMWLAGVRHVALDQHCLRSFGQPDRPRVDVRRRRSGAGTSAGQPATGLVPVRSAQPVELEPERTPGLRGCTGRTVERSRPRARPLRPPGQRSPHHRMGRAQHPPTEPRRNSARFRTCRNYQFAWWLRTQRNAPDAPPEYVPPKRPEEGEQMSLM